MKTKYFSNSDDETLEEMKVRVNRWITSHKITQVVEMKTSDASKSIPPVFFIKMSYDDKLPPRVPSSTTPPTAKRRN